MRVRGTLTCLAAAGVALSGTGCGGDDDDGPASASVPVVPGAGTTVTSVRTVTVPTATSTSAARTTTTRAASPSPTTRRTRPSAPARPPARPAPEPTTTAPAPTTPDDDSDPVGGTTFSLGPGRGTGYTVRVPDGWFDGSKRLEGSGIPFDLTYVRGRGSDVTSNILIVRQGSAAVSGQTIDDLAPRVRQDILETGGKPAVSRGPALRVDGERAISFSVGRVVGGRAVVQRKVAVLHRRALFTVALTSLRPDFASDVRVLRAFLDSWRWT